MPAEHDLFHCLFQESTLSTANRPMRLHLAFASGLVDNVLLPQYVSGVESVCGAVEYRISCVAADAGLPLKRFIAVPASLEIVTDRGDLRRYCGIVTEAIAGDSDGGLATYQIVLRDALAIMEKRVNTRVFRNMNECAIVKTVLDEWRHSGSVLSHAFEYEFAEFFDQRPYPEREFTMQYNESDAAFIRRMLKRRGIGWYFRSGRGSSADGAGADGAMPVHTLVMFNTADSLRQNASATVRFHRDDGTEERDTITRWRAIRTLQSGSASLHSWDYKTPQSAQLMMAEVPGKADQGEFGSALAASLDDYRILMPHAADDVEDLCRLGQVRVARSDLEAKCFAGEGSVRDFCAGEYFALEGHPEIDQHPEKEREFVVTELRLIARNNLPKSVLAKVDQLFTRSGWTYADSASNAEAVPVAGKEATRVRIALEAVRRGLDIVPAYDPEADLPRPPMQSAVVVGPAEEEVHCDELGRVRIRFPGMRTKDHEHAYGKGASNDEADSAWVRVASNWAGNGPGSMQQCGTLGLPRVGTEVLVAFLGGDPDKPVVVGQLYNQAAAPPALSTRDDLPGNRYLSGIRSREIGGSRGNQLRFNDAKDAISAQLASDHGASQLNLGWLTQPPADGKGEARGEGAELRSDQAVAIRGGRGVLLTSSSREEAEGHQLDRAEMLDALTQLRDLVEQLAEAAQTHAKDEDTRKTLDQLVQAVKAMDGDDAKPIVAVNGPAGVAVNSGHEMAFIAEADMDAIGGRDIRASAGQNLWLRAALGASLFANKLGIKMVAAAGKVQVQAQGDAMELLAKKVLEVISTSDWINLKAKKGVRINGAGSELVIDADGIKGYTTGNHEFHAADHRTFPAQSRPLKFDDAPPSHDICVECLLKSPSKHRALA